MELTLYAGPDKSNKISELLMILRLTVTWQKVTTTSGQLVDVSNANGYFRQRLYFQHCDIIDLFYAVIVKIGVFHLSRTRQNRSVLRCLIPCFP